MHIKKRWNKLQIYQSENAIKLLHLIVTTQKYLDLTSLMNRDHWN